MCTRQPAAHASWKRVFYSTEGEVYMAEFLDNDSIYILTSNLWVLFRINENQQSLLGNTDDKLTR